MTFLPIVERELRVAARKRSTFSLRAAAALTALALAGILLLAARLGAFGITAPGVILFRTLAWLALVGALLAGLFFASGTLAEEKQEGTLGLLFLTDLSGYDVVAGKLGAIWFRAFYALLAVFPVLALAFFMGGVEHRQFWRTALALVNVLFCSVTVGMFVSGLSRDGQKAMGGTFVLLLFFAFFGPCMDKVTGRMSGTSLGLFWSASSPVYVFTAAQDSGFSLYWPGLGTTHLLSWGLLGVTCLSLPRAWQDKKQHADIPNWLRVFKHGTRRWRTVLRRRWLERSPVCWLTARERWQSNVLWTVCLLLMAANFTYAVIRGPRQTWNTWDGVLTLVRMSTYLWAASQAGRFFAEARRSGFLELLLTTPLDLAQLIKGQWQAWFRLYGLPLIGLYVLQYVVAFWGEAVTWGIAKFSGGGISPAPLIINGVSNVVSSAADLLALGWFGLWMGMTSRNATLASVKALLFVQIIPWFAIAALSVLVAFAISASQLFRNTSSAPWMSVWTPVLTITLLHAVGVGKDIAFIVWSRRRLYSRLRTQAAEGASAGRVALPLSPASETAAGPQNQSGTDRKTEQDNRIGLGNRT